MWILTTVCPLAAHGQEASPDAKETAKEAIRKAKIAATKVDNNNEELRSLIKQQESGIKPLADEEEEKLRRIWAERKALLELNRQVAGLLKVGNSVFSYPGLLSLSEVSFTERSNKYSMRLVIDFKGYEGGVAKFPTYRIVEFDEAGRITDIKEFATVKMVTK